MKYINEDVISCPVCASSKKPEAWMMCQDTLVSGERFQITTCVDCGHLCTNPRPRQEDIIRFYASDDYASHQDKPVDFRGQMYSIVRQMMALRKKKVVTSSAHKKHVFLDIGCGTGFFLTTLHKAGYKTLGVEPSDKAREIARKNGLEVYKTLHELPGHMVGTLGGISLWHVLEHVYDVRDYMKTCYQSLLPGACLFIAVPLWTSYDALCYRQHWAAYDLPRHIHHFSENTLMKLAEHAGFDHVKKFIMPFDSFYISLLSEQHMKSLPPVLAIPRALIRGAMSNLQALLHIRPASSELFVFRKPLNA